MQEHEVIGIKYRVHSGTVEALGNELTFGDGSLISMLRFTDGTYLRNVGVDGSVGPYIQPGQKVTLAYVKSGKNNLVLAVDADGYGLRCTDPENLKKGNGKAVFVILFFGAASLLALLPLSGGINSSSIFTLVIGSPFLLFTALGIGKLGWSARMESLINALEQRRSIFANQTSEGSQLATGAMSNA